MEQKAKSTPKDVFMHLLAVATLYWSAFNLIQLLFEFVNVRFPDTLNPYYDAGAGMRWNIASLVIIFPVFIIISFFLHKDIRKDHPKAEIKIRKWLVYLTLFLAALLIIGDLVALIYNFLNGELTVRFFLKILSVLAVAGAIFGYYLYDLRKKDGRMSGGAKAFVWIVSGLVALSLVFGFMMAGSPFTQREMRFDNQRINDLQMIQSQIVNYWQTKNKLPATLSDLTDSISGFTPPQDPETNTPYQFTVQGQLSFELCANFDLPTDTMTGQRAAYPVDPYNTGDNWTHSKGPQCFSRTIDPERYPPIKKAM